MNRSILGTRTVSALASVAIMGAAALSSCNRQQNTVTFEKTDRYALTDGARDSLEMEIRAEYPSGGMTKESAASISRAITADLFGKEYSEMDPKEAIEAFSTDKSAEYREDNLPLFKTNPTSMILGRSCYRYGNIVSLHNGILSYLTLKYDYTGGAHGMTSETAMNFDTNTGASITEKDFFTDGYNRRLSSLLRKHLPEAFDSPQDTAMLFVTDIEPNGNFTISEQGITYIYNQYEIAPYSMGTIRVTVPWTETEGLLRKDM